MKKIIANVKRFSQFKGSHEFVCRFLFEYEYTVCQKNFCTQRKLKEKL